MRSTLAAILTLAAIVLVPFANVGVWVQRELVGTTSFVRLGEQALDRAEVRDALSERIVSDLSGSVPGVAGREQALQPVISAALASPAARPVVDTVLANTHDQLRNGHDPLQLDVTPVLPAVRAQLPAGVAAGIPPALTIAPVTVLRRQDAPVVWGAVQVMQGSALVVALLALAAFAGALLAARRRGTVCIAVGIATLLSSLGLLALVKPGRSVIEQQQGTPTQRAAFLAGYDAVTRSFVQQTVAFAVLGGLIILVGFIVVWQERRNVRPTAWA
jgi:hypothetical protein